MGAPRTSFGLVGWDKLSDLYLVTSFVLFWIVLEVIGGHWASLALNAPNAPTATRILIGWG